MDRPRLLCIWLLIFQAGTNALHPDLRRRLLFEEPCEQLEAMAKITDGKGTLERTFLSPAHRRAASEIQHIMADAGLHSRIDAVANVRGKVTGRNLSQPVLLSGSHYDTVKDAGRFDGMLGIIVPIAAVKAVLIEAAVREGKLSEEAILAQPHISVNELLPPKEVGELLDGSVELLAFCDEEGIRFQTTFLGSRALVGDLKASGILGSEDKDGITVRQSLGLSKTQEAGLSRLAYSPGKVKGYVEVHMEQGPVLEAQGMPLGVVAGIAGQTRLLVMVLGTQGHAGTVPMVMRRDPMATAAEIIHWIERRCGGGKFTVTDSNIKEGDNLVCTTGNINLWPNAFNVIPGSANFTLDIRSRNDEVWQGVTAEAKAKIEEVCNRRGVECVIEQKTAVPAVHSDEELMQDLRAAIVSSQKEVVNPLPGRSGCATTNHPDSEDTAEDTCENPEAASSPAEEALAAEYEPLSLISGAGHDALAMAKLTKMAMMFVRCRGGHSHSPLEFVSEADVGAAAAAMYSFFEGQLL